LVFKIIFSVVAASAVALGAFAGTASAEVSTTNECVPFFDFVVCFEGRSVGNDTVTPSGNYTFISHSNICYTITYVPTGEVTEAQCSNGTYGDLVQGSELQVHHSVSYGVLTSSYAGGFTCRGVVQSVWANGELRHEFTNATCSND
jgi:hypothetical protein